MFLKRHESGAVMCTLSNLLVKKKAKSLSRIYPKIEVYDRKIKDGHVFS